jgi:hypothetical protein
MLGADTWAAVASYLRNVMLNQWILIAFLGALLYLPWILGSILDYGTDWAPKPIFIAACGAILIVSAIAAGVVNSSTCAGNEFSTSASGAANADKLEWTSQREVLIRVVLPLFAGAFCLNYTMWRDMHDWRFRWCVLSGVLIYTLGHVTGWLISAAKFGRKSKGVPAFRNILWAIPCGVLAGIAAHTPREANGKRSVGDRHFSYWHSCWWERCTLAWRNLLCATKAMSGGHGWADG